MMRDHLTGRWANHPLLQQRIRVWVSDLGNVLRPVVRSKDGSLCDMLGGMYLEIPTLRFGSPAASDWVQIGQIHYRQVEFAYRFSDHGNIEPRLLEDLDWGHVIQGQMLQDRVARKPAQYRLVSWCEADSLIENHINLWMSHSMSPPQLMAGLLRLRTEEERRGLVEIELVERYVVARVLLSWGGYASDIRAEELRRPNFREYERWLRLRNTIPPSEKE